MLPLIPTIPLCPIILCIVIHFHQHIRLKWCHHLPLSGFTCCGIILRAHFDFFPISFLLYMIMVVIASVLVIVKFMNHNSNPSTRLSEICFASGIDLYLYCLIILLSLWDSLFSFYRYYTTRALAIYLHSIKICSVLKAFSFYIIVFIVLFMLQTRLYYYIFAPILVSHLIINIYWILNTTRIIMNTAKHSHVANQKAEVQFFHNVVVMRSLSILSALCSTVYIALFMMTSTMDIVYYFPLIWSVSTTLFTFNFVRNRQLMRRMAHTMHKCTICTPDVSFVVYVEGVDDKQTQKQIRQMQKQKTPLSVPIINDSCHTTVPNKSHSTGNLRSFLPKGKLNLLPLQNNVNDTRSINTSPSYITPSSASPMPMETPLSVLKDDGTIYCGTNGEFPVLHINVTPAAREAGTPDSYIDIDGQLSPDIPMHFNSLKDGVKSHSCQELQIYSELETVHPLDALIKPIRIHPPPVLMRAWTVTKPPANSASPDNKLGLLDIPETPASLRHIPVRYPKRNHLALDIDPVNTRSLPARIMHQNQNSANTGHHRSSRSKDHLCKMERQTSISSVMHLFVAQGFCDGLTE
eukprot:253107_1